jgi:hypothetical protein
VGNMIGWFVFGFILGGVMGMTVMALMQWGDE